MSPPSTICVLFFFIPPHGEDNLKGHRNLFTSLKQVSWTGSFRPMMPPIFTKRWNNQGFICQDNLLLKDFAIALFVYELIHWLQVRVPPCNIWFHNPQHINWHLTELNTGTMGDLTKTEKLQYLVDLWAYTTYSLDSDDRYQAYRLSQVFLSR